MCSIVSSYSKDKIVELIELNKHRGNFSYSISIYDPLRQMVVYSFKSFGDFNYDKLESIYVGDSQYIICHIQAPTGGLTKNEDRIHPTRLGSSHLWHNGLLKPAAIKKLQKSLATEESFDTMLLHDKLQTSKDYKVLSDIEGLFSCMYSNNGLNIFRTKHGKLYVDDALNISSEKFDGSKCINFDTIYSINFSTNVVQCIDTFKTFRFNFVINGDME